MAKRQDKMRIGAFLMTGGHHATAWRLPETYEGRSVRDFVKLAQLCEAAKMDMVFFADTVSSRLADLKVASTSATHFGSQMFEPLTLLSAIAMATSHIGLTSTASTMYYEPYNLARLFASLDRISEGRAGWNIVTSAEKEAAENFGVDRVDHDDRYKVAEEFVDVMRGLWDSWDDDAFVIDKAKGQFFAPDKVHYLNHEGPHFKVKGPLNIPRPTQGHPVLVQAGTSGTGRDLAARVADVVFSAENRESERIAFYKDIKDRAAKFGRPPESVLIMPGLNPVVGRTKEEAMEKFHRLNAMIDPVFAVEALKHFIMDVDLRKYPIDGPVPEIKETTQGNQGRQALLLEKARRDNLTIRELGLWFVGTRGHWAPMGTPEEICDELEENFDNYAADGFNLMPMSLPGTLKDFCELVIPELQRRGRFRIDYEATTLRGNLGLPYPARGKQYPKRP